MHRNLQLGAVLREAARAKRSATTTRRSPHSRSRADDAATWSVCRPRTDPSPIRGEGRHRHVRTAPAGQLRRYLAPTRPASRRQGTGAAAGARRCVGDRHAPPAGLSAAEPPRRTRVGMRVDRLPRQPPAHLAGPHRRRQARAGLDQGEHRRIRRRPRLRRDHRRLGGRPSLRSGRVDPRRSAVPARVRGRRHLGGCGGRRSTAATTGSPRRAPAAGSSSGYLQRLVVKKRLREHPQVYLDASPITRVRPDAPPFFVLHGEDDSLIPVPEGREFVAALRDVSKSTVAYAEIPHAQHAFDFFGSPRGHYTAQAVEKFLSWVHATQSEK